MKIALVVPSFPQLSETFIAAKAVGLVDRGHDVQIVCARSSEDQWRAYGDAHRVHELRARVHLSAPTSLERNAPARAASIARGLLRERSTVTRYLLGAPRPLARRVRDLYLDAALIALQPDVVHFEFGTLALGRTALKDRLGCAFTVSFRGHDINFVGLDDPNYLEEVWDNADSVHTLSHALWRQALRRGAPEAMPHVLISPAIDAQAIDPPERRHGVLGGAERPLRVLSVGRLHWNKGYEYALEAMAELRRSGVHVEHRIVGDGPLREAVAFWRHQLGLDDCVEMVGAVEPEAVGAHYAWADVMLHAATAEGFCNAVIEAQAHALPVVTSDAGGLPENVEHGLTGLVVPRRDPVSLAASLAFYASQPVERLAAAGAARQRVLTTFRWAEHLDAWEAFYEGVT